MDLNSSEEYLVLDEEQGKATTPTSAEARQEASVTHRLFKGAMNLARWQKRAIVLSVDIVLCIVAALVAFSLRMGALDFPILPVLVYLAVAVPLFIPIFLALRVYRSVVRFIGGRSLRELALATAFYTGPLAVVFLFGGIAGIPRTIAIIHPMVFFGFVVSSRLLARFVFAESALARGKLPSAKPVLIYGAGSAGKQLAAQLDHEKGFRLVAFVDDDIRLSGEKVDGVSIHHSAQLKEVVEENEITLVLLAMPSITRRRRREILVELGDMHVQVKTLPGFGQLVDREVSVSDLRDVKIEDLLGRDPVPPNELLLTRAITGKVVMVTGAGGSIGSELCRQIIRLAPSRLVLVEFNELGLYAIDKELNAIGEELAEKVDIVPQLNSVVDREAMRAVFDACQPQTVFHAAAYKHVPLVEANPLEGLRNNVIGTTNVASLAKATGSERFILVSTDKAVRPTSIMGASKRICELALHDLANQGSETRFAMVRFGNVLGSSGSVVPLFRDQISQGGPITLTHRDITRYFMTIPEAAQLVIQAGGMATGGEVYLLDMGEPMRIHDLAVTMVHLSGLSVKIADNPNGDIEIREVGLRPGEKLYEELLIGAEAQETRHPKIFKARDNTRHLPDELEALMIALAQGDEDRALSYMRLLVPEYSGGRGDAETVPGRIGLGSSSESESAIIQSVLDCIGYSIEYQGWSHMMQSFESTGIRVPSSNTISCRQIFRRLNEIDRFF